MIESDSAILAAICLGDSSLIDNQVVRNFRVLNCSHLLAVSGSHFGAFLLVITFLLDKIKSPKRIKLILNLVFILLIGSMTGWTESVTRAAILSIFVVCLRDSISGISFAALIMMLSNPYVVLSLGFNMSFLSYISIICCSKTINSKLEKIISSKSFRNLIVVTISAQVGMLIFAIDTSYRIGLPQFLSQIISGILVEVICVFFLFGVVFSGIFSSSFEPSIFLSQVLKSFINCLSNLYCYSINVSSFGSLSIVICFALIVLFLLNTKSFINARLTRTVSFVLVFVLVFNFICLFISKPRTKVIFLDVKQGDSCLIITDRFNCLVDSGTLEDGFEVICDALDYYSIDKLDMAIMTHWDEDHGGAMLELLKAGKIDKIYTSYLGNNENTNLLLHTHEIDSYDRFNILSYGQTINLSKSDTINVLWPINPSDGENDDSLVLDLKSYGCSFLLTGDISANVESEVLLSDSYDFLKVAHHGSRFSSSLDFLQRVNPKYAIISVGKYNNYGHPSEEVLDRLSQVGAIIFNTSKNGAIIVNISKDDFEIVPFKENLNAF